MIPFLLFWGSSRHFFFRCTEKLDALLEQLDIFFLEQRSAEITHGCRGLGVPALCGMSRPAATAASLMMMASTDDNREGR